MTTLVQRVRGRDARRPVAVTFAAAICGVLAVSSGPNASAAPISGDPAAASTWMTAQLTDNGAIPGFVPGSPDMGLTIDYLWALQATGAPKSQINTTWGAVARNVKIFAGPMSYGSSPVVLAGASAKVLLAAATTGSPASNVGGVDILKQTLNTVQKSGPQKGRLSDSASAGSDSTNIFSQSLGVLGFVGTGQAATGNRALVQSAVDFLVTQQCSGGYFRMFYNDNLSCDKAKPTGEAAPDNDGTALSLQALLAARKAGLKVPQSSIDRATSFLLSVQKADGSFGGGVSTEAPNSNSTGLVAATLQAVGKSSAAAKAGTWVASLQLAKTKDVGAIAYDKSSFDSASKGGIDGNSLGSWQRATPQAVFALVRVPFIDLKGFTPPVTPPPSSSAPSSPAPSDSSSSGSSSSGPTSTRSGSPDPSASTSQSASSSAPTSSASTSTSVSSTSAAGTPTPTGSTSATSPTNGLGPQPMRREGRSADGTSSQSMAADNEGGFDHPAYGGPGYDDGNADQGYGDGEPAEKGAPEVNRLAAAAAGPFSRWGHVPVHSRPRATPQVATPTYAHERVVAISERKKASGGPNWAPIGIAVGVGGAAGCLALIALRLTKED